MTVSEAERIKAVERVRVARAPIFGGTPSYKRKRGIYRALARGDFETTAHYQLELGQIQMMRQMWQDAYDIYTGSRYKD